MKVIYAPIVSSASGRFQGLVASRWKGVDLIRVFMPPANPNSTGQQDVRNVFRNLNRVYAEMSTEYKAAWQTFAAGKRFIGRNVYIGRNVPVLKGMVNNNALVFSPGDASTIPLVSLAVVDAGGQVITFTMVTPTPPTGWTINGLVVLAHKQKDWGSLQTYTDLLPKEHIDSSPQNLTVGSAGTWVCGAFIKWLDAASKVRYSAPLSTTCVVA